MQRRGWRAWRRRWRLIVSICVVLTIAACTVCYDVQSTSLLLLAIAHYHGCSGKGR